MMSQYPAQWLQIVTDLAGKFTLTGTFIGVVLAGSLNALLIAWLSRQFLRRNTIIQQEVQNNFAQLLSDYKLALDKQLVDYKRHVDQELAETVEPLRASLNRNNIAYQLTQAEYIRRQFTYAEELYGIIFQYHKLIANGYQWSLIGPNDMENLHEKVKHLRQALIDKYHPASLFLSDEVIRAVDAYDQAAFKFIMGHTEMVEGREYKRDTSLTSAERINLQKMSKETDQQYRESKANLIREFVSITNKMKRLSRSQTDQSTTDMLPPTASLPVD